MINRSIGLKPYVWKNQILGKNIRTTWCFFSYIKYRGVAVNFPAILGIVVPNLGRYRGTSSVDLAHFFRDRWKKWVSRTKLLGWNISFPFVSTWPVDSRENFVIFLSLEGMFMLFPIYFLQRKTNGHDLLRS